MSFEHAADYRAERSPDEQYKELLHRVLHEGEIAQSGMDEGSLQVLGHVMRFDMNNGFPMITERDLMASIKTSPEEYEPDMSLREFRMSARQGLGEIIGFINGARTVEELAKYGNKWWSMWATPEKCEKRGLDPGDLGPGSYGAAFHDFPGPTGETVNQFQKVIEQVAHRPELRTHIITPFIPSYIMRLPDKKQGVVVVPCHGSLRFDVNPDDGHFDLVHTQRSADVPIGLPFNMIHYSAVMAMFGKATGYKPRQLVYMIDNAHIYSRHTDMVEELLSRQTFPFPKLHLRNDINDFFDIRVDDFRISDYRAHPPLDMNGTPV